MNRKKHIALIAVAALSIGLLSGYGCAAHTDETNTSVTQSESSAEQESAVEDTANDGADEIEVVDEAEIELGDGEASGGM